MKKILILTGRISSSLLSAYLKPLDSIQTFDKILVVSDGVQNPELPYVDIINVPKWALNNKVLKVPVRTLIILNTAIFARPDCVVSFHLVPNSYIGRLIAFLFQIPHLIHIIGAIQEVTLGGFEIRKSRKLLLVLKKLVERMTKSNLRQATAIMVTGSKTKSAIQEIGISQDSIFILPAMVNIPEIQEVERDIDVIYLGRLDAEKRPDRMIKLYRALSDSRDNLKMYFVGTGDLHSETVKNALKMGLNSSATFTGYVDNVTEYLNRSKIFILMSDSEGLSVAMKEAMACGTVPVVPDVGDLSDLAIHRKTGILINSIGSDDEIIDKYVSEIITLLDTPQEISHLSTEARNIIRGTASLTAASKAWTLITGSILNQ